MSVIELNEENFKEEVLESDKPVLVDFYATWCGPCKMMSPIVDKFAEENDNIKVCKIDTDEAMDISKEYGIMSIPCIISFKDGKEFKRNVGLTDKNTLSKLLED